MSKFNWHIIMFEQENWPNGNQPTNTRKWRWKRRRRRRSLEPENNTSNLEIFPKLAYRTALSVLYFKIYCFFVSLAVCVYVPVLALVYVCKQPSIRPFPCYYFSIYAKASLYFGTHWTDRVLLQLSPRFHCLRHSFEEGTYPLIGIRLNRL